MKPEDRNTLDYIAVFALGTLVIAFFIGWVCIANYHMLEELSQKPLEGDLNHDNQLTLVDLSILAERIRTQ